MSHAAGYTASYFRHRIEDHFEEQDLGVICRKQKHAYALYWADDQTPLAKIQRMGQGDEVQVWWWDDGRWRQTGDSGTTLSLDKALEYITDDPDHYFFRHDDAEEDGSEPDDNSLLELKVGAMFAVQPNLAAGAMFSGAVGGLAGGPGLGVVWGVLAAVIGRGGIEAVRGRSMAALKKALTAGAPLALLAAPAATIGGLVHETQSAGVWGYVAGAAAGACSALLMLQRSWCAWLLGATAGIVAAEWLAELVRLREHLLGLLLIVFVASCVARFYAVLIRSYRHAREFFQSLVDGEFVTNDR